MTTNNVQAELAGVYVRATKKGNAPVAVEKVSMSFTNARTFVL